MSEPERMAYWRHRSRTTDDEARRLTAGIRSAITRFDEGRPMVALRILHSLTTPKETE